MLLDSADGRFQQFCTEYGIAAGSIGCDAGSIHVLTGPDGEPLEDITDEADNTAAADSITEHVRLLTHDPQAAVHASIAGGRKTMGFFLGYAMSLYGRAHDRLSHVLVSAPFEQDHQFYYPPAQPKRLIIREQPVHTSGARIMLADIPIVRLRDGLPERLRQGSSSYSATVSAAQLALQPPHLCIDLTGGAIEASGLHVDLTPTSLATLALFARRAAAEQGPMQAPHKEIGDTEWAERFLTEYRVVKGELQEDDETLVALRRGMDDDYLSQRLTRLHQELNRFALIPDDVLGFLAETATEVRASIAIDNKTGTVKQGALWYEENLPAESLLWGVYAVSESMNRRDGDQRGADALATCLTKTGTLLQLGGKAGVGRGLVRFLTLEATA